MSEHPRYLPLDDEPDDGCNGHFPIVVTEDGNGPADNTPQAFMTVCWCGKPGCMLFYGDDRFAEPSWLTKPEHNKKFISGG